MNILTVLRSTLQRARRRLKALEVAAALAGMIIVAIIGFHYDERAYALVANQGSVRLMQLAEWLSYWGDFQTGTLIVTVGLYLVGTALKREHWQRAAVATLLTAVIAGGLVSAVRLTAGRTRPDATLDDAVARLGHEPHPILSLGHMLPDGKMLDGFYGPQRPAMFQGFPSGHSSTSVGTTCALVAALPEFGIVTIPVAIGVCWSRLYLHKHHLSDVLVGAWVGLMMGIFFGRIARRKYPADEVLEI